MEFYSSFENDPVYINISECAKVCLFSIFKHMDKVKYKTDLINAGTIYNSSSLTPLSHEEIMQVASTIKQTISSNIISNPDDITTMYKIIQYMCIPLRINTNSIPSTAMESIVNRWYVSVVAMMFNTKFAQQCVKNTDYINFVYKMNNDVQFRTRIGMFNYTDFNTFLISNPSVYMGMNIAFIQSCTDIILRFNPALRECLTLGSADKKWIQSNDVLVSKQLSQLQTILK